MNDPIRDGVQAAMEDSEWILAHYVTVAAFQRLDGECMESTTVLFTGEGQGSYITEGLLLSASRLNDIEVDEDADPA